MQVGESCSGGTKSARARAAACFIPSVICTAPHGQRAFEQAGKDQHVVDLVGEVADRPVPTTAAPWARAMSGMISGTGLAMARTNGGLGHGLATISAGDQAAAGRRR